MARQQDDKTTRPRDCGTTRPRDDETTRLRDNGTTRQRDNRKTQAFPGVPRRSQPCEAARSCARQLVVRVVQMWRQVEVWLDGGVLARTSPFRRTSLVPQMRRYHVKGLVSEGRRVLHSAKMPSMGSTCAYVPLTAFFVRGRNRPLITPSRLFHWNNILNP